MALNAWTMCIDATGAGLHMGLKPKGGAFAWFHTSIRTKATVEAIEQAWHEGVRAVGIPSDAPTRVWVATGPGSFTGIKISLAWAYGLKAAYPESMMVSGYHPLGAVAQGLVLKYPEDHLPWILLENTKTHGFLWKSQSMSAHGLVGDVELVTWEHVAQFLDPRSPLYVMGTLGEGDPFKKDPSRVTYIPWEQVYAFARAGLEVWGCKDDHSLPQPYYVRPSSAEEALGLVSSVVSSKA